MMGWLALTSALCALALFAWSAFHPLQQPLLLPVAFLFFLATIPLLVFTLHRYRQREREFFRSQGMQPVEAVPESLAEQAEWLLQATPLSPCFHFRAAQGAGELWVAYTRGRNHNSDTHLLALVHSAGQHWPGIILLPCPPWIPEAIKKLMILALQQRTGLPPLANPQLLAGCPFIGMAAADSQPQDILHPPFLSFLREQAVKWVEGVALRGDTLAAWTQPGKGKKLLQGIAQLGQALGGNGPVI